MIAAHLRLRPVMFRDMGDSTGWALRCSAYAEQLEHETAAPAPCAPRSCVEGRGLVTPWSPPSARLNNPLHGGVLYAVPEA